MTKYIYAYTHAGNAKPWTRPSGQVGDTWIKVGETVNPGIDRVRQQVGTAFPGLHGVQILFHSEPALRADGTEFSDRGVHRVLRNAGIVNPGGEWFEATEAEVWAAIRSLQRGLPFDPTRVQDFEPRPEQRRAVELTAAFFRAHGTPELASAPKFLWNAKMRFGKTFTTYQLAKEMGWTKLLILTYKPAVRSAWRDDLLGHVDFIDWQYVDRDTPPYEADALVDSGRPTAWFASFQDVIGRDANGKPKPRNETLHIVDWDCIVIDEFHFGASTAAAREVYDPQDSAEAALAQLFERASDESSDTDADVVPELDYGLKTKYHLHLSGTPFKAITNGDYDDSEVFNWTYIDEQRAKSEWNPKAGRNPYAELPQMRMYTYAMGAPTGDWVDGGEFNGFDLNTYFKAKRVAGAYEFEKPDYVASFLDLIRGKKALPERIEDGDDADAQFPYEAAEFKEAVKHSVWYMPDVAACEAMAAQLRADPFFSTFEIYVAAGAKARIGALALPPLQAAIRRADETGKSGSITLSCGKLMTGVTVPEWSSIFMLRSLKAPESYFQAAFRVQSPWKVDGEIKKQTAYVFEFDPNRALSLIALYGTELANNSADKKATQASVLGELINFLPIFAIDGGRMEQLDVQAILDWAHGGIGANALARRWKSTDLYNLNGVTMDRLLHDADLIAELEQIEDFRSIREEAEKIVTASKKLATVKRDGGGAKEQRPHKKAIADQRKDIRAKLKKVSAKVLIFMYLTDFREERLKHVIESLDTELFLRSTGLSLESYGKLTEIGVIDVGNMTDAIQKFRYFEKKSIEALVGLDRDA
ncbi:GIY-YIG nuclease family protein [Microbacterium abyssi]|uniref:GIY-YIG nuclease family protein n=1 Tax=Microbacterium abyssi TaxID=2782166 RepID=UPI001886C87E|nr:GIY-YIG nuclease family protein [Microbacterium sp. A18JL241]